MNGIQFVTADTYSDDSTIGPFGYPIQVLITCDAPVFMQFASRRNRWARVTWEFNDVPYPPGDYRFAKFHGVRIKSNGDTPANVYAISVFKEDVIVQGFSPSNTP